MGPLAVTIQGFLKFIDDNGGRDAFVGKTTWSVAHEIVVPLTKRPHHDYGGVSLVEHMLEKYDGLVQPADWYVSHAWRDLFLDTVDALVQFCSEQDSTKDLALWFCVFNNNQHAVQQADEQAGSDTLLAEFETSLTSTGRIVMVMHPWYKPITLSRIWCVFEVYVAEKKSLPFAAAMGAAPKAEFLMDIVRRENYEGVFEDMLTNIDSKHATATKDRDKDLIHGAILAQTSFDAIDVLVNGVLIRWIESELEKQRRAYDNVLVKAKLAHAQGYTVQLREKAEACNYYMDEMNTLTATLGPYDPNALTALGALTFNHPGSDAMWRDLHWMVNTFIESHAHDQVQVEGAHQYLSNLCVAMKKFDRARDILKRALERVHGQSEGRAIVLQNLSFVYLADFDFEACEPVALSSFNALGAVHGPNHVSAIAAGNVLARCYTGLGKFHDAAQVYDKILWFSLRAYDKYDINTLATRALVMDACVRAGLHTEARAQAAALRRDTLERVESYALGAAALVHVLDGQASIAVGMYRQAYDVAISSYGEGHTSALTMCSRMYLTAYCTATDFDSVWAACLARRNQNRAVLSCAHCGNQSPDVVAVCPVCLLDAVCMPCHHKNKAACIHDLDQYRVVLAPDKLTSSNMKIAMGGFDMTVCCAGDGANDVAEHWDILSVVDLTYGKSHDKTQAMVAHVVDLALDLGAWDLLNSICQRYQQAALTSHQLMRLEDLLTHGGDQGTSARARAIGLNLLLQVGHADVILNVASFAAAWLEGVSPSDTQLACDLSNGTSCQVHARLVLILMGVARAMAGAREDDPPLDTLLREVPSLVDAADTLLDSLVAPPLYALYAIYVAAPEDSTLTWRRGLERVFAAFVGHDAFGGEDWVGKICSSCDGALRGDVRVLLPPSATIAFPMHHEWTCATCWKSLEGQAGTAITLPPLGRFLYSPTDGHGQRSLAGDALIAYFQSHSVTDSDVGRAVHTFATEVAAVDVFAHTVECCVNLVDMLIRAGKAKVAAPLIDETNRYVFSGPGLGCEINPQWKARSIGHRGVVEWVDGDRGRAIQTLVAAVDIQSTSSPTSNMLNLYVLYQMLSKATSAAPQATFDAMMRAMPAAGLGPVWMDTLCIACQNTIVGPATTCSCCDDIATLMCKACRDTQVNAGDHSAYTVQTLVPLDQFFLERDWAMAMHAGSPRVASCEEAYELYCDLHNVSPVLRMNPGRRPQYLTSVDAPLEKTQRELAFVMDAAENHWSVYFARYCGYQRYCDSRGIATHCCMSPHALPEHEVARIGRATDQVVAAFNVTSMCTYWRKTLPFNYRQLHLFLGPDHAETHRTLDALADCAVRDCQWNVLEWTLNQTTTYDFAALDPDLLFNQWSLDLTTNQTPEANVPTACATVFNSLKRIGRPQYSFRAAQVGQTYALKWLGRAESARAEGRAVDPTLIGMFRSLLYQCSSRVGWVYESTRDDSLAIESFQMALVNASPENPNADYHRLVHHLYRLWFRIGVAMLPETPALLATFLNEPFWPRDLSPEVWHDCVCSRCKGRLAGVVFVCDDCPSLDTFTCVHCWVSHRPDPTCRHGQLQPLSPPHRFLLERQIALEECSSTKQRLEMAYGAYCDLHSIPSPERQSLPLHRLSAPHGHVNRWRMELQLAVLARRGKWTDYVTLFVQSKLLQLDSSHPTMELHLECPDHVRQILGEADQFLDERKARIDEGFAMAKAMQHATSPNHPNVGCMLHDIALVALTDRDWAVLHRIVSEFPSYEFGGIDGRLIVRMIHETNATPADKATGLLALWNMRALELAAPVAESFKAAAARTATDDAHSQYLLFISCMLLGSHYTKRHNTMLAMDNYAVAFKVYTPTTHQAKLACSYAFLVLVYAGALDDHGRVQRLHDMLDTTGLSHSDEFEVFHCDGCHAKIGVLVTMCFECMNDRQYCEDCVEKMDGCGGGARHEWTSILYPKLFLEMQGL